ncbi:substrate-binding domain-containing protein [Arsenicicoccus piscis]|uniref:substrate-binding domain-containing protein n=1 Tax=Arsenicicoccus piscis TaxID=673954 RepID=UPI0024E18EE7|nr:substrate-binding domain-containing protein [Arsenicicoccus piscis]
MQPGRALRADRGGHPRAEDLQRRGIPVVLVDRAGKYTNFCSVSVDDVEGGRLAASHLLDLGHERIAVVGGPSSLQQVQDRRLGAELALGARRSDALLLHVSTAALDIASGVAAAGELAGLPDAERPTAVFALNDLLAIGVLQGCVTHGLRVPDDVAIVGYDDILFAAVAAVPLSSVRQPRARLGRRAAELLFDEVAALDEGRPHTHEHVQFAPELVVRRSSQPDHPV